MQVGLSRDSEVVSVEKEDETTSVFSMLEPSS